VRRRHPAIATDAETITISASLRQALKHQACWPSSAGIVGPKKSDDVPMGTPQSLFPARPDQHASTRLR
jgi:hypothetical protein